MSKLVLMLTVDVDADTLGRLCLECGGVLQIPGTDMYQLQQSAQVPLSSIIKRGVQSDTAHHPISGVAQLPSDSTSAQPIVMSSMPAGNMGDSSAGEGEAIRVVESDSSSIKDMRVASRNPDIRKRMLGILGKSAGLRGNSSGGLSGNQSDEFRELANTLDQV